MTKPDQIPAEAQPNKGGVSGPTLKKALRCWERDPNTGADVLRDYGPGDPVPAHLTAAQIKRLTEAGVI